MFGFIKSIKKFSGFEQKPTESNTEEKPKESPLEQKIEKLANFFDKATAHVTAEYKSIREKSKDLSNTNYNLGMKYLESGNLKEAIFRFKVTKKFWPHNYESYYQLAICLILSEHFDEAHKVIDELLEKSPDYQERVDKLFGKVDETPVKEGEPQEATINQI